MADHARRLRELLLSTGWFREVLCAVRDVCRPASFVAAGAVRDTVWNRLTGRLAVEPRGDIDVVYFDPIEVESADCVSELARRLPAYRWEVTNQAFIHRWHESVRGTAVAPHANLDEALATWPETATAVAVRLRADYDLDVIAPFGLDDLFDLVVRSNCAFAPPSVFEGRLTSKRWLQRWPELKIVRAYPEPSPSEPATGGGGST